MNVLTKGQADKAIVNSVFNPGGSLAGLKKERLCRGKYEKTVIGREVPQHVQNNVKLVWAERRQDRDGAYYALYCLSKQ